MLHHGAAEKAARRTLALGLVTALLFCVTASGCNNVCFSFTSNPPTGRVGIKVSDAKPSCTLSPANGAVHLQVTASSAPGAALGPASIQHIFVSVRGIEAHQSAIADEDSPDWQEMAPKLAQQPAQVDLLARPADLCAPRWFDESVVPAAGYRQIRLLLLANHPGTNEPLPAENACGSVGFNCVITADGNKRLLAFDGATLALRVPLERIGGGVLVVLPDASTDLAIEFDPGTSLMLAEGEAVRLVPVFTVARRDPCEFP